jgi:hypothetical protein
MLILPQYDAVVAITSGVRDMQAVMNLVWSKLLPAMSDTALTENAAVRGALQARLSRLAVHLPAGKPNSPVAARVSKRWYDLAENASGIKAVALDFSARPALLVRSASGETRTPIGLVGWVQSPSGFTNGIDHMLSVAANPAVAASGAWTTDSTFTVKLVAPETPFYSTMAFHFQGDRLLLDAEHNVSFGNRTLPRLEGRTSPGK